MTRRVGTRLRADPIVKRLAPRSHAAGREAIGEPGRRHAFSEATFHDRNSKSGVQMSEAGRLNALEDAKPKRLLRASSVAMRRAAGAQSDRLRAGRGESMFPDPHAG